MTWQQSVEAITFARITLTLARLTPPLAARALTTDRVRRFVRYIWANLVLPLYDKGARGRREIAKERGEANALCTSFIKQVFALLSPSPGVWTTEVYGEGNGRQGQQPQGQQLIEVNAMMGYRSRIRFCLIATCARDTEDIMERLFATFRDASGDLF
ncbi:hypothetical protein SLS53_008681 [Cytospora paraplurivora]|uniref:Uncharacterized protein n=1 Tax=Cytospora paraplurivora TaxID=2898453 RepID=A0AAN9TXM2_9PEZI